MNEEIVLAILGPISITDFAHLGRVISAEWPDSVVRNGVGRYEIVIRGDSKQEDE